MKAKQSDQHSQCAAELMIEIGAWPTPEGDEAGQKLHDATFDEAVQQPELSDHRMLNQPLGEEDCQDDKITLLLDEIVTGFDADDASNFEKLTIARRCGPLLLKLKRIVPHGMFKSRLKERYPKVSYSKCNRWMFLARHEDEVVAAIEKYPEVAWGPKKMIDFINGVWTPEPEDEGDMGDDDEEEWCGNVSDMDDKSGNETIAVVSYTPEPTTTEKPGAAFGTGKTHPKKGKAKNPTRPPVTVKHKSEPPPSEPEDSDDVDAAEIADELGEYGEVYSSLNDALMKLDDALW